MKKFIEHSEIIDGKYKITEEDEDGKSIVTEHNINFKRESINFSQARPRGYNGWSFSHLPMEPRLTTYELRLIEYAISYSGLKKTTNLKEWLKSVRDELIKRGLPPFEEINLGVLETIFTDGVPVVADQAKEILEDICNGYGMEIYSIVSKMDNEARGWS